MQSPRTALASLAGLTLLLTGCAAAVPVATPAPASAMSQPTATRWPVKTAEHIDLWLHAFALLSNDSAAVPLYRLGYRDSLTVIKNRANILTSLDANRVALATGLLASPGYLQAQFLPLDVANWDVLRAFAERFLQYEGEARRASDKETAARLTQFAAIFPNAADREWLRLFLSGVTDEHLRFFADEHSRAVRSRAAVITAVDSLWQRVYRTKFDRFLTNTGQRTGDIVLSLPVGGEGRTGVGRSGQTVVVVPFPSRVEDANHVLFVFAHEVTGALVGTVVADNSTPAEQRAGVATRLVSAGQVRAGAMLLERLAPELLDPYMRYYLMQGGARIDATASATVLSTAFVRRFVLPDTIRDALVRQIEIVLGGI
ncbi:MAG: hypothetical protein IPP90_01775 [Gemmatimonadaceae bacterium]|nr:hypothetical protein [Gemmatimonadaceae bacterium]